MHRHTIVLILVWSVYFPYSAVGIKGWALRFFLMKFTLFLPTKHSLALATFRPFGFIRNELSACLHSPSWWIYDVQQVMFCTELGCLVEWRILMFQERQDMKSMFRVCATERLFVPDMFPAMDRAIYVDTDLIFLRWKSHNLWSFPEVTSPIYVS